MQVIESFMESKNGDMDGCEDSIFINDHFACVIDGVSSKFGKLWEGKTSGKMATILLENAIKVLPRTASLDEAVAALTLSIADYYQKNGIYENLKENTAERFSATISLYSDYHREVWSIGDVQCLIDGKVYVNRMLIDDIVVNTRALYLELELIEGKQPNQIMESDLGRKFISSLIQRQGIFQNSPINSPYAFGVVDGFDIPKNLITVTAIGKTNEVVLASDGYPDVRSTLMESEAILATILKEDPLCMRIFKAVKGLGEGRTSYDDRAYLRFRI
ncbi:MAG: hypothetical protein LCH85_09555 [Chloroflexi bacterium]|nr:hypothetical protein [Chloroflexota bacterium]